MPVTVQSVKSTSVGRNTFAARDSSPKNGATKTNTTDVTVIGIHGAMRRRRMKNVSSPRLPYQITRYCPKVR